MYKKNEQRFMYLKYLKKIRLTGSVEKRNTNLMWKNWNAYFFSGTITSCQKLEC